MEWYFSGLVIIAILVVLLVAGLPIAASLGLLGVGVAVLAMGWERALHIVSTEFFSLWTMWSFLAVPLFVAMGEFLIAGGVMGDIVDVAAKWLRRLPGGLALVCVAACAFFAAMSGSSIAAAATMGVATIPEMLKKGYDKRLATGVVACAGALAHMIPPSNMAVIYAIVVEASVGKQLMAGLIPGILLAIGYALVVVIWVVRNPSAAPTEPPVSWRERLLVLRKIILPAALILVTLGTLYTGVVTVTEAAGIGALGALLLAFISRRLTWITFRDTLLHSARTTSFIMLIATGAYLFSWALTYYMIPQHLVGSITQAGLNRWVVMIMFQLMYVVLGMVLDLLGMILVTMPFILPILPALGFDVTWFGVLLLINMEIALITPPVGFNLYVVKGIAGDQVTLGEVLKGSLIMLTAAVAVLILVMIVPQLALWLPSTMGR